MFLGYVIAVGGVIVAVLLLAISIIDPQGLSALRGVALDATTPVTSGGRGVVRFFGNASDNVGNYISAGSQNASLKRRLAETRQRVIEARAIELENRRLKAMLGLSRTLHDKVATARIVGSSFQSSRRFATLAVGAASGIRPGQPVRAPEGLIGRVLETGRHAARVLLITDGANFVPVKLVRDGTPALSAGVGDGTVELRTLTAGKNPFRRGDIVVTTGTGGLYPPNVPVAMVTEIDGERTIARPLADPAQIDFALVERVYQPLPDAPAALLDPPVVQP